MDSILATFSGWGMVVLRVCIGGIFIVHGSSKVRNPASIAGAVWKGMKSAAFIHGLIEVVGGIALIFGFWMNPILMTFAVIMVGAIYYKIAKWKISFMASNGTGWEFDTLLLAGLLALLLG